MFYKEWEIYYNKILKEFEYSYIKDKISAEILNDKIKNKQIIDIPELSKLIKGKNVYVFGAGTSIKKSIKKFIPLFKTNVKIVADGATSAFLENNIIPEIIVTDLDGKINDQIYSNLSGSIAIIHAHGDNIKKINTYFEFFKGKVLGSTQIDPQDYINLHNFGGFTDGDRAIFLSEYFKASKIFLIGYDFNKVIGEYSYTKKRDITIKLKKLEWCKLFIEILKKNITIYTIFNLATIKLIYINTLPAWIYNYGIN